MADTTCARAAALLLTGTLLSACADGLDMDMRGLGEGLDTSDAALAARTEARPEPDARGVISYPTYQVAVARPGDDVGTLADRVGVPAAELASYNGLPADAALRAGELVALPRRVAEPSRVPGVVTTSPIRPSGQVSVATIAGSAIDRAEASRSAAAAPTGTEPQRHRVGEGETAFSIARRYGVSVDALAQWNGLGADRAVRVGQFLLIARATATIDHAVVDVGNVFLDRGQFLFRRCLGCLWRGRFIGDRLRRRFGHGGLLQHEREEEMRRHRHNPWQTFCSALSRNGAKGQLT